MQSAEPVYSLKDISTGCGGRAATLLSKRVQILSERIGSARQAASRVFAATFAEKPLPFEGLSMIGFVHRDASSANQGQSSDQNQFGRVVHHAVKDIDIYRATRDQRTRSLAATAIISPFATGAQAALG